MRMSDYPFTKPPAVGSPESKAEREATKARIFAADLKRAEIAERPSIALQVAVWLTCAVCAAIAIGLVGYGLDALYLWEKSRG